MQTLSIIPTTPTGYALNQKRGAFAIVIPEATINLVTNPSFELNTTGWATTGTNVSINRTNGVGLFGSYGLIVIYSGISGANSGARYTFGASIALSGIYTASCYIMAPFSTVLELRVNGVTVATERGRGPDLWVRMVGRPLEISSAGSATIDIVRPATSSANASVRIDGVQFEQKAYATTYCDGDQLGFVSRELAYLWTAQAHGSTSQRLATTRAGGRIMNLQELGYLALSILGLSMSPFNVIASPTAQGGALYQNTIPQTRSFSLVGVLSARSEQSLDQQRSLLTQYVSPKILQRPQPLRLIYENYAQDGKTPISTECDIMCHYSGGLEGQRSSLFQERSSPEFQMFVPYVSRTGVDSAVLAVQEEVLSAAYVIARDRDGNYATIGTGLSGPAILAAVQGDDGYRYAAGTFFTAGGVANTEGIARWNLATLAWEAAGTGSNGNVFALAKHPDGSIYAGGDFAAMSGVANTRFLAKYNTATNTWSSIGTTTGGSGIEAIIIAPNNMLYVAGSFTTIGGVAAANIASYDGSVWAALGTGTNAAVYALAISADGSSVYAGGNFTSAGGVASTGGIARWAVSGATWNALSSGINGDVYVMRFGPNQALYVAGNFSLAGGISTNGIVTWNGTTFASVGGGINSSGSITHLAFDLAGNLHLVGEFNIAGSVATIDLFGYAIWNGSTYIPGDFRPPGSADLNSVFIFPNGDLWFGHGASGTAITVANTTITYDGTAESYPTFVITGPTSGDAALFYRLVNATTGAGIFFNLSLLVGEVITLNLDPRSPTYGITSSTRGNLTANVLAGSNWADWSLQPGENLISVFAEDSTMTVTATWRVNYLAIEHAVLR